MSQLSSAERDTAIADFFKVLTGLGKLCEPLLKAAVKDQLERAEASGRRR